ncbi:MAG TPA: hypothetical protein VE242_10120 [Chthoniobacterales bacterium]|nr:hypothetical protein [Chthoniobacterales bacterium]
MLLLVPRLRGELVGQQVGNADLYRLAWTDGGAVADRLRRVGH